MQGAFNPNGHHSNKKPVDLVICNKNLVSDYVLLKLCI